MTRLAEEGSIYREERYKHPIEFTALNQWMVESKVSNKRMAKMVGCSTRSIVFWKQGQSIPVLVYAFKIEQITEGKVSVESWLGTMLGKQQWDNCGKPGRINNYK